MLQGFTHNLGIVDTLWLLGLYLALFFCVLLHEYGHALMARRYGVTTKDIILTPIGGIARLERMPERPVQEFLVAIAGPMVNVFIALFLTGIAALVFRGEGWGIYQVLVGEYFDIGTQDGSSITDELPQTAYFSLLVHLSFLVVMNIWLVVFNLIPAFPMDGGRIFRSLLAMRFDRVRATQIASWLGQGIAVLFILYGMWEWSSGNFNMLAVIGFFVFMFARTENAMVRLDALLRRFKARDLMRPQFTRLNMNDWMQTPVTLLQQGLERHFLVFDFADRLAGVLEESDIIDALKKRDLSASIQEYADNNVTVVNQEQGLDQVYQLLQQQGASILAVTHENEVVGVIDRVGLQNFLRMQV